MILAHSYKSRTWPAFGTIPCVCANMTNPTLYATGNYYVGLKVSGGEPLREIQEMVKRTETEILKRDEASTIQRTFEHVNVWKGSMTDVKRIDELRESFHAFAEKEETEEHNAAYQSSKVTTGLTPGIFHVRAVVKKEGSISLLPERAAEHFWEFANFYQLYDLHSSLLSIKTRLSESEVQDVVGECFSTISELKTPLGPFLLTSDWMFIDQHPRYILPDHRPA